MVKISKKEKEAASHLGRLGGLANAKKNGKKHMKSIGKLGAKKRWGKVESKKASDLFI
jgi:hypothetical protein